MILSREDAETLRHIDHIADYRIFPARRGGQATGDDCPRSHAESGFNQRNRRPHWRALLGGGFVQAEKLGSVPEPGTIAPATKDARLGELYFLRGLIAASEDRKPEAMNAEARPESVLMVAIGGYDGFFGPGVGSMLIVMFVVVFGDSLTRASGNAKVVNLASNLAALGLFAWKGTILWSISLPMAAANALGVNVPRQKMAAFAISAVLASLSGSLYAFYFHFLSPEMVGTQRSLEMIAMLVVGGEGTLIGALFGVALLTLL